MICAFPLSSPFSCLTLLFCFGACWENGQSRRFANENNLSSKAATPTCEQVATILPLPLNLPATFTYPLADIDFQLLTQYMSSNCRAVKRVARLQEIAFALSRIR